MGPVRVFVVDDSAAYRAVATAVIEATAGFELIGSSSCVADAVARIPTIEPSPDLVLLDVNLGEGNGVEVATAVGTGEGRPKVVFVSALAADELPLDATTSGAAGYLPKAQLSPGALEGIWRGAYDWRL